MVDEHPPPEPRRVDAAEAGIDLRDGTWVDVDADGRWRPSVGERVRSIAVLAVFFVALAGAVLLVNLGDEPEPVDVAEPSSTSTTTEATTTTTTEPPDPSSVGGAAPSERCSEDDREALPLRDRAETTVLVLNGTPRAGHAGENTDDLVARGYDSVVPDNASIRDKTSVHYREGFCAEGERMANDLGLPLAEVSTVPRNLPVVVGRAELVVILGRDTL